MSKPRTSTCIHRDGHSETWCGKSSYDTEDKFRDIEDAFLHIDSNMGVCADCAAELERLLAAAKVAS